MPNPGDQVNLDELFYRRYYISKSNPNGNAVSSRVFKVRNKDNGKLSVDAVSLTTYEKSVVDEQKFSLFEIANEDVVQIKNDQGVALQSIHDPLLDSIPDNPAHCLIFHIEEDDDVTPKLLSLKAKPVAK